jgi:hypothetical protein
LAEAEPEGNPEVRPVVSQRLLSRGRLLLMAGAFVAELGIFAAGLLVPIDAGTRGIIANQTSTQFAPLQNSPPVQVVLLIFSHNAVIAMVEIVPLLGAFAFISSIFATGVLAQALLASNGVPGFFGAFLLLFPYTLVELSAYAVALGSGVMLIAAWRKRMIRSEALVLLKEVIVVMALLLVAAVMEEITSLSPLAGIALWAPTGLAVGALVVIAKRSTK